MAQSFPFPKRTRRRPALLAFAGLAAMAIPALAQTSGANGSHDPSRMIESEGRFYIYSTGGGGKSSADGLVWKSEAAPPWNMSLLPNNQRIWAPDLIYLNGLYYLYGAMWNDSKASVIVGLSSPTLNPASPNYKWTDLGTIVPGPSGVTHSVIDVAPVVDNDGKYWIVWGGGYPFPNEANSIWLTPMDPKTGLALTSDAGYKPPNNPGYPLQKGHKEGPYIYFRNGYYYLWWQTGSCCNGASSTYAMTVARSQNIKGPYTGDRKWFSSSGSMHGPGHIGIYDLCGASVFTYHYYPNTGGSVVGMNTLTWGSDGWPVAGPVNTKPLTACLPVAVNPGAADEAGLQKQVQRTAEGFRIFVPEAQAGMMELLNVRGERIAALETKTGWNQISRVSLASGLNLLRFSSGRKQTAPIILNNL